MVTTLKTTASLVAGAQQRLDRAMRLGLATPEDQGRLEHARAARKKMPPAQHALDPGLLAPIAKEAATAVERLQGDLLEAEVGAQRRRLALVPVVLVHPVRDGSVLVWQPLIEVSLDPMAA